MNNRGQTKDELDEDFYFSNWKAEHSGNYVGWLLELADFSIIVSRQWAGRPGEYDLCKVPPGVKSNSDPFGEHPEWYNEFRKEYLSLKTVKEIVKELLQ